MDFYMDHVFKHVPQLDLLDIDQNMSIITTLIVTCDPEKKKLNQSMLRPCNPHILGNMSRFCPNNNIFILWYTNRQPLDWPLISIHAQDSLQIIKKKLHVLDLQENCKSQNFSKGAFW